MKTISCLWESNRGDFVFLKWIISILIYLSVFFLNLTIRLDHLRFFYVVTVITAGIGIFLGIFIIVKKRQKRERNMYRQPLPLSKFSVLLSTVFKNEGQTIINTLRHYLTFSHKIDIVFYDDQSDDGSYEELKKWQKNGSDHITIKTLTKSQKILHPKGMGFEDMVTQYDSDYYCIIDADTIIEEATLEKALNMMEKEDIRVLHFTRRNDLSNDIANNIADTEELFSTVNKVIGIFPWYFNGSGFIMKGDVASMMAYDEYSPSDDCQISYFLRKKGIKVYDALSLFAHEKAPSTIVKFLKQHSSWTKGGIHHYIEKERFTIFFPAFISAYFLFSLINPAGIYNIFLPLAFIFIWSTDLIANVVVAKRSFKLSFRNALLHTLSLFYKGMVTVPYHIFTFPFKRFSFWFTKTRY